MEVRNDYKNLASHDLPDCLALQLFNILTFMPRDPLTIEAEVQQVLDELWTEKLIPFALNVGKITKADDEYIIHFHDSRLRTAHVPLTQGHSFKDMVRSAVLARVAKLSGPLKEWFRKG